MGEQLQQGANKHIRRCSTSLVIQKIQIKLTTKQNKLTRIAKIKKVDKPKLEQECGIMGTLIHHLQNTKCSNHLGKLFCIISVLKENILYYPVIHYLMYTQQKSVHIDSKDRNRIVHSRIHNAQSGNKLLVHQQETTIQQFSE